MKPNLRRFALTAHVTFSAGWLGAVVAYLALAIAGLASPRAEVVRAAYLSMEVIGWFVIVPLGLATLIIGLVVSLGTPWGLFRHWWVLVKFVMTTGAIAILLQHMPAITRMSDIAGEMALSATDFRDLRIQLAVHAGGGLLVLIAATVLSVYKPWGMTPYGRRAMHGRRQPVPADMPPAQPEVASGSATLPPRWAYIIGIHAAALALLFVVLHLAGGGAWKH